MVVINRKIFGAPTIVQTFTVRWVGVPELDLRFAGIEPRAAWKWSSYSCQEAGLQRSGDVRWTCGRNRRAVGGAPRH